MDSLAGLEPLAAGTVLSDRYLVEFILGQGGMGSVYFSRDQRLNGQPVAIKEMRLPPLDERSQQQAIAQFRQEAYFLTVLDHPNLVKVTDFFEQDGRHYLVMAYIKGRSLGELLKGMNEPFPVPRVLEWTVQLVEVLAYLHGQNPPILFRDLKPNNIMLDSSGGLHLIDFGISRVLTPDSYTATFMQGVGSADYCPLEQYQGAGGTDQRSDIYSLGATLFHLLTLHPPPRVAELVSENRPVPSPKRYNPNLPAPLEELIVHMMAVRKEDRYRNMDQVRTQLQKTIRALEGGDEPGPERPGARRRREAATKPATRTPTLQGPWLALGGLTLVVLALMVWLVVQMNAPARSGSPSPSPVASQPR